MSLSSPPDADELEVSLFGPGYGECVVVHLGEGRWLVVDSCKERGASLPAPLAYFEKLGVNVAEDVVFVLASHWHDDHTRGLAQVVRACPNATFIMPEALKSKDFVNLVRSVGVSSMIETSGASEFAGVLDALQERAARGLPEVRWACGSRVIWRQPFESGSFQVTLTTLSPSDEAITRAKLEISSLLPKRGEEKRRLPSLSRNDTSVALLIERGADSILLGSDLETSGWRQVVMDSGRPQARAGVVKIPHHGSTTGHHDDMWTELLTESPVAVLTPFVNGSVKLPTSDDISRLKGLAGNSLYVTSTGSQSRFKHKNAAVERTLKETAKQIRHAQPRMGHVRLRKRPGAEWGAETFGAATKVS